MKGCRLSTIGIRHRHGLSLRVKDTGERFVAGCVVRPRVRALEKVSDVEQPIVVVVRGRHLKSEGQSGAQYTEGESERRVSGNVLHRGRIDLGRQAVDVSVGT